MRFIGTLVDNIGGFCRPCQAYHQQINDKELAQQALADWWQELENSNRTFAEKIMQCGGKMIAVLVGINQLGQQQVLRGFSGDLLGVPDVEGFVPSLLRRERTRAIENEMQQIISHYTMLIDSNDNPEQIATWKRQRKLASQTVMSAMHDAATLTNRGGVTKSLREIFVEGVDRHEPYRAMKIPSGTADCALPKIIHHANSLKFRNILGVAEAWFGPDYSVQNRIHGTFAEPCLGRCFPILGFLLCHENS